MSIVKKVNRINRDYNNDIRNVPLLSEVSMRLYWQNGPKFNAISKKQKAADIILNYQFGIFKSAKTEGVNIDELISDKEHNALVKSETDGKLFVGTCERGAEDPGIDYTAYYILARG